MEYYTLIDIIPLSFSRVKNNALVSGLTVTVTVKNGKTGATLLAATSCPEITSGAGIYTYNWTHGLIEPTECLVEFSVNGHIYSEFVIVTNSSGIGTAG